MNEYEIGKDIGGLLERVRALEHRVGSSKCGCGSAGTEKSERTVRFMTDQEKEQHQRKRRDEKQATQYCTYMVAGFVGNACPGIAIGDFLCVSPCPPCPDVARLRILDAQGNVVCTVIVRWAAAGNCTDCPPGGHMFIWA